MLYHIDDDAKLLLVAIEREEMVNLGIYVLVDGEEDKHSSETIQAISPVVKDVKKYINKVKVNVPDSHQGDKEFYILRKLLDDASTRYAHDNVLIIKPHSVLNTEAKHLQTCLRSLAENDSWDACYLGRWNSSCPLEGSSVLSEKHVLLHTPGQNEHNKSSTAIMFTPQGRSKYLKGERVRYSAVLPSIFTYDSLQALSQGNLEYFNECERLKALYESQQQEDGDFGGAFLLLVIFIFIVIFLFILFYGAYAQ